MFICIMSLIIEYLNTVFDEFGIFNLNSIVISSLFVYKLYLANK
jgi:hypothetical protein